MKWSKENIFIHSQQCFSVSLQSPVLNQCRSYLMTVENCGCNLSEYPSGLVLLQSLPLTEVIVQLPTSSYLHHQHHLLLVLKHWTEHFRSITMTPLLILPLTFVDVNDVRMLNWGHDLDLSSDPDQICLGLYLALLDGLDGHLIHYIKINTLSEFSYNCMFFNKKEGNYYIRKLRSYFIAEVRMYWILNKYSHCQNIYISL